MTKFNEFTDVSERGSKIHYVDEFWTSWSKARLQALTRITNYLFVLNTGALLASLAYVASKQPSSDIQLSIWLFSVGILCSVLHATIDYYCIENCFTSYQKDVEELYDNKLDWDEFVDRNNNRVSYDWILHILGWTGALVFFGGLVIGVLQLK